MIEMESGASGSSAVERSTRCAPESCHLIVARASPGHGGPSGGLASSVHVPTSGSSRLSASSAVGWSIASLLPLVGGCGLHKLLMKDYKGWHTFREFLYPPFREPDTRAYY